MANVLNIKELLGTSYYFLEQYFGNDVPNTYSDYQPFELKEIANKKKQDTGAIVDSDQMIEIDEEITGIQKFGNSVLENKNGEEIASLTLTELPTLYSSIATSSVDLQMVPGKMIENKDRQVEETYQSKNTPVKSV